MQNRTAESILATRRTWARCSAVLAFFLGFTLLGCGGGGGGGGGTAEPVVAPPVDAPGPPVPGSTLIEAEALEDPSRGLSVFVLEGPIAGYVVVHASGASMFARTSESPRSGRARIESVFAWNPSGVVARVGLRDDLRPRNVVVGDGGAVIANYTADFQAYDALIRLPGLPEVLLRGVRPSAVRGSARTVGGLSDPVRDARVAFNPDFEVCRDDPTSLVCINQARETGVCGYYLGLVGLRAREVAASGGLFSTRILPTLNDAIQQCITNPLSSSIIELTPNLDRALRQGATELSFPPCQQDNFNGCFGRIFDFVRGFTDFDVEGVWERLSGAEIIQEVTSLADELRSRSDLVDERGFTGFCGDLIIDFGSEECDQGAGNVAVREECPLGEAECCSSTCRRLEPLVDAPTSPERRWSLDVLPSSGCTLEDAASRTWDAFFGVRAESSDIGTTARLDYCVEDFTPSIVGGGQCRVVSTFQLDCGVWADQFFAGFPNRCERRSESGDVSPISQDVRKLNAYRWAPAFRAVMTSPLRDESLSTGWVQLSCPDLGLDLDRMRVTISDECGDGAGFEADFTDDRDVRLRSVAGPRGGSKDVTLECLVGSTIFIDAAPATPQSFDWQPYRLGVCGSDQDIRVPLTCPDLDGGRGEGPGSPEGTCSRSCPARTHCCNGPDGQFCNPDNVGRPC